MISDNEALRSPDNAHGFDLIYEGEIRFGPFYFKLKLDGVLVENRIFGDDYKWHPESKYLALQEWLTTSYRKGPITALTLVELETRRFAQVSLANKGFVKPIRFENGLIVFKKEFGATGEQIEYEISLADVQNWESE